MRIAGGVALVLLVVFAVSRSIEAVCIEQTLPQLVADEQVALIFQGTLLEKKPVRLPRPIAEGAVATFEVTRVWKGQAARTVTVNFEESIEGFPLDLRKEYLVIARSPSASERQRWAVPSNAEAAFMVARGGCGNIPIESPMAQKLIPAERGGPPR